MTYTGNRTDHQQNVTDKVVQHIFSNVSFMSVLLRDAFEVASYDKIIPQFGTDSSYYSVLQYLLSHKEEPRGNRADHKQGLTSNFALPAQRT